MRQARQEHDSIVGALRAELLTRSGELGQARESYDRLVAACGTVVESHGTPTDPQLLVEVLVLRERMAQAIIEKKKLQETSVLAASHLEAARIAHGTSLEAARLAHGSCREELTLKNAQVIFISADLESA